MSNKYKSWSDEDLKTEWELIMEVLNTRKKKASEKRAKALCINGITSKDIAVEYGSYDGSEITDINDVNFSFFVKHDGKLFNIYYDSQYRKFDGGNDEFHPWWPLRGKEGDDEWERNGAFEFVPPGFAEACENSYEFNGTFEEAIERLNKYGITDIKKGDW